MRIDAYAETEDGAPYKVYTIGKNKPSYLMNFVEILENCLIKESIISESGRRVGEVCGVV